ncbi:MAG TPA: HlyD family efflux transporter periplasmic adaptor subunit [Candidatus Acidoferrales bacterium]|nr:HlyD family efflux transporter periplasmic adaptor subunit [Candidatus Acidoferrales bacterium]
MNLARALEVALPEIPARTLAERYPRLDPATTFREHIEDGKTVVRLYVPSAESMFTFPPYLWKLAQLFDGTRSYEEIAQLYSQENGGAYDGETVREMAGELEADGFWYRTPQEKNILMLQQTSEERRKKVKVRSRWADLSDVTFPAFNPDRFLDWLYGKTKFIYTPWFTALTLLGFAFCLGLTISHWKEIWRDTLSFYNFSNKSWGDVLTLYTLGMVVVAVHELAHAHTCKHYGGHVRSMGFALVYLTPAFYTDTTEGAVLGSRYQRLIIFLAGIWSELILCSIATPIWWGTPPETLVHDGAYFIMMMTGMMSLIINWNPLMKLDGYYMLCEIVGVVEIKENSTAFVSAWMKKHIWGLPVEVPYVPKRRRIGFAVYALLSGAYSYTVLYVVARFAGNFVRNFSPEWGFIPEIGVALLVFRSRIRLLVNFMKFIYLDKKDRILAWFTPKHTAIAAAVAAVFLAIPIWHESVAGKFLLEPISTAEVRARVPGTIENLYAVEGQAVAAGQRLAQLRNLPLQSEYEEVQAELMLASARSNAAALHYTDYGAAQQERKQLAVQVDQLSERNAGLELTSPIDGIVLTAKVGDMLGTYVKAGTQVLEVGDIAMLRARIYVSEFDFNKIRPGSRSRLEVQGHVGKWEAISTSVAQRPVDMDSRLGGGNEMKGAANLPHYYQVDLQVSNPDLELRPGMAGIARVYVERRSLAGMALESIVNFWGRKLW